MFPATFLFMKPLFVVVGFVLIASLICSAQTVNLWPGIAPGSEHWTQKEQNFQASFGTVIIDVVTPTLTLYLPDKAKATGTGVIVAPGGACVALAYDYE